VSRLESEILVQDLTLSLILRSWSWQPLILVGLGSVAAGYAFAFYYFWHHDWLQRLGQRGLIKRSHPWYFMAGLATLFVALLSPIDALADLLFLMHMLQHILLMMVAPLLILLGLPAPLLRWLILETKLRPVLAWLTYPLTAYTLFTINFLAWHVPVLYEAALRNGIIHDIEHALFFYTALFFWWRIIDPTHGWFPMWHWLPAKWVYLLVAAPPSYVLGSILWASSSVWYSFYIQVPRLWGLSPLQDQRYGGMLMWIQGWMFIMASMIVFFIWYDPEKEQADI
jgi:cytochrome c oxidase assembly factor CtaG